MKKIAIPCFFFSKLLEIAVNEKFPILPTQSNLKQIILPVATEATQL